MLDKRVGMPELQIQVYENQQLVHSVKCPGLVELGRQAEGEEGPYWTRQEGNHWRVVVARLDEQLVSRRHLAAESFSGGQARITNLRRLPIRFLDGSQLEGGASREMSLPVFLVVGNKNVGIQSADTSPVPLPQVPIGGATPQAEAPPAAALRL